MFEARAQERLGLVLSTRRRAVGRRQVNDGHAKEISLRPRDTIRVKTSFQIVDSFTKSQSVGYETVSDNFAFLTQLQST